MVLQKFSSSTPHPTHSAFKVPTPLAARPTLVTTYIFAKLYIVIKRKTFHQSNQARFNNMFESKIASVV
jgi:hypothetical protein